MIGNMKLDMFIEHQNKDKVVADLERRYKRCECGNLIIASLSPDKCNQCKARY